MAVAQAPEYIEADALQVGSFQSGNEIPGKGACRQPWWMYRRWHALAYLALLVALLGSTNLHNSWTADDGAYATQVKVIQQTGQWAYPYKHTDIDPHFQNVPVTLGVPTSEGKYYDYIKLPAWIEVLRASTAVFGEPLGFYVPSALGALAAALVAWALADRFERRAGPWAFWAVALGPLLVHTTAMWAHTAGAALGGGVALLVVDAARRRFRWVHSVALALCLGATCLVRDEGALLVAASLPVVAILVALPAAPLWRRFLRMAEATALPAVASAAALLGTRLWAHRLAPGDWWPANAGPNTGSYTGTWTQARVAGATRTLLDGAGENWHATELAFVAVLACLLGGILLARRRHLAGAVVTSAGLLLLVVRTAVVAPFDLAGFAAASPLVVVALAGINWRAVGTAARALLILCGLYVLAVLATEYPEGGSRDWGGRFLFLVLVPIVVGAVLAARRLVGSASAAGVRRTVGIVLIACVAVPAILGLYATNDLRDLFGAMTNRSTAPQSAVVIRMPNVLSRLSWRVLPEDDWLTADPQSAPALLEALRRDHSGTVTVSGPGATSVRAAGYTRRQLPNDVVVFTPTP